MADCDVNQKVPAFFAHSWDEQIRSFAIVIVNGPEDSELLVVHSQARRVCQRLDVVLNGIVSVCDQELELGALPKVAWIGPVNDHVISAAAMGWQFFEGEAQSEKAAFAECFGRDDGFVVLGYREKPRTCEGSIAAEDSCFVSGSAIGRHLLFKLGHTGLQESFGEEELQFLLSEATRKLFHNVDSLSVSRVFDYEHVGSEDFNIFLHLH